MLIFGGRKRFVLGVFPFILILILIPQIRGLFNVSYECLTPVCVEGGTIVWNVNVSNVEKDTIRVYRIEIKDFEGTIASYSEPFEVPFQQSRSVSFSGRVPSPQNLTKAYYYPCFTLFRYDNKTLVPSEEICYNLKEITVMPSSIVKCSSDENCSSDSRCEEGLCFKVRCEGCARADQHKCVSYECCSNSDCSSEKVCSNHSCIMLRCPEDYYAEGHICRKLYCGLFEIPRKNRCAPNHAMYAASLFAIVFLFLVATFIFLKNFKVGGKTLWRRIQDSREAERHKMEEQHYLNEAEIHRELLRYEKDKEEIRFHTAEMKRFEQLAARERKVWEKILGLQTCPECKAVVDIKLRICPRCGARLKGGALSEDTSERSQYER